VVPFALKPAPATSTRVPPAAGPRSGAIPRTATGASNVYDRSVFEDPTPRGTSVTLRAMSDAGGALGALHSTRLSTTAAGRLTFPKVHTRSGAAAQASKSSSL
jgi:hypothetical protein